MKKIDTANGRFYQMPSGEWGASVTTIIDKLSGTSQILLEWFCELGYKEAILTRDAAAAYGTIFHAVVKEYLLAGYITKAQIERFVLDFLETEEGILRKVSFLYTDPRSKTNFFWTRLFKDLIAFESWLREKNVKPIIIEQVVVSEKQCAGGCIDLICDLDFGGKRKRAMVDFKTGNHIWESHGLQLCLYSCLWNELNIGLEVEMLFNWKPKDWTKSPSYDFVNQTEYCDHETANLYFALARKMIKFVHPKRFEFSDTLTLCSNPIETMPELTIQDISSMYSITYEN